MEEFLELVPESFRWLAAPQVLTVMAVSSGLLFIGSLVGVPWFLSRMPADYFSRRELNRLGVPEAVHPLWYMAMKALKNVVGVLLLLVGIAMLLLPGQGLVTIFVAFVLLDFPGKKRLERRIITTPAVLSAINALRRKAGRPPLILWDPTR